MARTAELTGALLIVKKSLQSVRPKEMRGRIGSTAHLLDDPGERIADYQIRTRLSGAM